MANIQPYKLGPLVRLSGLTTDELPAGASGGLSSSQHAPVTPANTVITAASPLTFLTDVLNEAIPFLDTVAPKALSAPGTLWKQRGPPRRFSASESPVEVYSLVVAGADIDDIPGADALRANAKDETWICRRSVHRDAAQKGTASWEEFVEGFKEQHAETEKGFIDTVIGAREAATWEISPAAVVHTDDTDRWGNCSLKLVEMKHGTPKPLKTRVFPTLQVSAEREGDKEFVVVSIPITDMETNPHAEYAREKSVVVGKYVAVERIRRLPDSGDIEWIMATAADAGGVLPQWMQNMAMSGLTPHDVEWYMEWVSKQRKEEGEGRPVPVKRMSSRLDRRLPPTPSDGASYPTALPPPPIFKSES